MWQYAIFLSSGHDFFRLGAILPAGICGNMVLFHPRDMTFSGSELYSQPGSVADLKISASGHDKSLHKELLLSEICGNSLLHRPRDMISASLRRYPNMPAPLSDLNAQKKKDAADSTLSAAFWRSGSRCILLYLCYNIRSAGQTCCSCFINFL